MRAITSGVSHDVAPETGRSRPRQARTQGAPIAVRYWGDRGPRAFGARTAPSALMAAIWGRGFGCNVVRGPTRLAAMPGTNRPTALLALAGVVAILSGCGSGNDINGQIPRANADQLNAALSGVQAAVASTPPDCATAASNANQFVQVVNGLPAIAGTDLKTALRDAGGNLQQLVGEQCPPTGPSGPSGAQPP